MPPQAAWPGKKASIPLSDGYFIVQNPHVTVSAVVMQFSTASVGEFAGQLVGEPMLLEEGTPGRGQADNVGVSFDQPAIRRVFPDRQFGARRPPGIHRVVITTLLFCYTLKKIQNQALHYEIGH